MNPKFVIRLNNDKSLYYTTDINAISPLWYSIPCNLNNVSFTLIDISISNGKLCGIKTGNDVVYSDTYTNPTWISMNKKLSQAQIEYNVSYSNYVIIGVYEGVIYYTEKNFTNPIWKSLPNPKQFGFWGSETATKYITIRDTWVYAINQDDNLFNGSVPYNSITNTWSNSQ